MFRLQGQKKSPPPSSLAGIEYTVAMDNIVTQPNNQHKVSSELTQFPILLS